jgi:hypothetical protein
MSGRPRLGGPNRSLFVSSQALCHPERSRGTSDLSRRKEPRLTYGSRTKLPLIRYSYRAECVHQVPPDSVCIVASPSRTIYVGVTNDLARPERTSHEGDAGVHRDI